MNLEIEFQSWEENPETKSYQYYTRRGEILHWGLATEERSNSDGSQYALIYNVAIVLTIHDNKIVEVSPSSIKVLTN